MRELTKQELVAMWFYGAEYARSGLSAVDWWKQLDASRQGAVNRFIAEYDRIAAHPVPGARDGR